jgi:hypothetical protein
LFCLLAEALDGGSEATFYRWKTQFAGMGVVEIRRLKPLEEENSKLKRLVADLSLNKTMLQGVLRKVLPRSPRADGSPASGLSDQRTAALPRDRVRAILSAVQNGARSAGRTVAHIESRRRCPPGG